MGDTSADMKRAVECGYWPLYRYDSKRIALGEPPFQLDCTQLTGKVEDFLLNQNRYSQLQRSQPEAAATLREDLTTHLQNRFDNMKKMSKTRKDVGYETSDSASKPQGPALTIAYGSDTGTAEGVARRFAKFAKSRGFNIQVSELNDVDLSEPQTLVLFVSTCGDGEIPPNAKAFAAQEHAGLDKHKFVLFALGDRGYAKFC